jgi:uncharacterized membrane protein
MVDMIMSFLELLCPRNTRVNRVKDTKSVRTINVLKALVILRLPGWANTVWRRRIRLRTSAKYRPRNPTVKLKHLWYNAIVGRHLSCPLRSTDLSFADWSEGKTIAMTPLISGPIGTLAVLAGICSIFFLLEKQTGWRLFNFFPPLLFIYLVPLLFSNTGVISNESPVYDWMGDVILPMFLTIMLLDVNVRAAFRVMGKGVFVMLIGTFGVIVGAPIGYMFVKSGLDPDAWQGFGSLAGSWIGGTGNMAAVTEGLGTSGKNFGLAVLADNFVYMVWLPIMLNSKIFAGWFSRFTGVSDDQVERMKQAASELSVDKGTPEMRHILYLVFFGLAVAFIGTELAKLLASADLPGSFASIFPAGLQDNVLSAISPMMTRGTYRILIITTLALSLSFTRARRIPGSHPLAMALVYLFVANMGGRSSVTGLAEQAPWFLAGAFIWIFIHGGFCMLGAKLFRVDVHTVAIASAANIGGAASAPVVAAYHNEALVPVSILMALIGYAIGNYGAFAAAWLCYLVS